MTNGVRPEVPADEAAVREIVAAAFRREDGAGEPPEAALLDTLRADPGSITGSFVAEADGRVVAHALLVAVQVGGLPASAVGMVAVHPDHQRRGHGTRVVWAAVHALMERTERLAVVLGNPGFYGRFGFIPAPVVGVYSERYSAPYLQAMVLQVDHPRGAVEYPKPYTDLAV